MAVSPAGFIGKAGKRSVVLQRSALLLLAVGAALAIAVVYRGNVQYAAVLPVIALSWLNRLLRQAVPNRGLTSALKRRLQKPASGD